MQDVKYPTRCQNHDDKSNGSTGYCTVDVCDPYHGRNLRGDPVNRIRANQEEIRSGSLNALGSVTYPGEPLATAQASADAALPPEALFQRRILTQHQQRQAAVQHGFRRDGHIGFAVLLHAEDIDAVLSADVQLTDAVTLPAVRDGDLDDGVLLGQLYVIEDVIGGVPDGRPLRQLLFRVCHRVRAVAQQKFCLYIPFGAGHHIFRPQLLEQGRRFQRVLEVSADGNVADIIVSNAQ